KVRQHVQLTSFFSSAAAASFCNVTCNTDYENVLNCSCSGSVPALPVLLNVTCRHRTYDDIVEGSCEIQPPRSWCTIVKSLIYVASVGTMCNTTASQPGSTNPSEMTSWELWNAGRLTDNNQHAPFILEGDEEHFELNQEKLQPGASYVADIQVKYCKDAFHQGPWSEWSSGAEWSTAKARWPRCVAASNLIICTSQLFLCFVFRCWQKKLRMITYIPRPNEYFKPLYQNYEGNFKVRESKSALSLNGEGFTPQLPNNLLPHFQHSGASQGTLHSAGHVSIHTVTLSGEEFEGEVTSQSSLRSYQDGESFGSFDDTHREDAPYNSEDAQASRMDRHSGISLRENQLANDLIIENQNFQADGELNEERVSLDSFGSNEQSEDGYPHVDLDTIDSGFGECISPGASDSHSNSFPDHTHLNSNYVKQWMICSTIQEDGGNVSSELNGTQQL
uniref:Fibronectin type-III domain-containing protein n=1 Tax=Fundulus heteroclitus TaxID=8078 RepID=A0A3Q2UMS0_FUNHE